MSRGERSARRPCDGEHPEVAVATVVEIHGAGRRALETRGRALREWMRTIEGLATLARREGVALPELDPVACAAIVLTAEAWVHDHARRGRVRRVKEKRPSCRRSRALFKRGVTSPS